MGEGPKQQAHIDTYNEKMAAYRDAVLEYNAKRIAAASATGVDGRAAVADWSMNAQTYYLKVKAAADAAHQAARAADLSDSELAEIGRQFSK